MMRIWFVITLLVSHLRVIHGVQWNGESMVPKFLNPFEDITPQYTSTGTTIVGVCCVDGVVLGADTRSSSGQSVANKESQKIHYVADNIQCCGAGTAAYCSQIPKLTGLKLSTLKINHGKSAGRISTAVKFMSDNLISNNLIGKSVFIIGGVDETGNLLYQIDSNGIPQKIPFTSMGSGSIAAMAILETLAKKYPSNQSFETYYLNITTSEAIDLVRQAVTAGILNDLGSGSHVDLCVITHNRMQKWREWTTETNRVSSSAKFQGTVADDDLSYLGTKVWSKEIPSLTLHEGEFQEHVLINRRAPIEIEKIPNISPP
jgi:20S proteasome subunit beta 2